MQTHARHELAVIDFGDAGRHSGSPGKADLRARPGPTCRLLARLPGIHTVADVCIGRIHPIAQSVAQVSPRRIAIVLRISGATHLRRPRLKSPPP